MAYLHTIVPPISWKTTLENARLWLNIVRYGEHGIVIQLQDDSAYRVAEVIDNPSILKSFLGPYYRRFLLTYIALDQNNLLESIRVALIQLVRERKIYSKQTIDRMNTEQLINHISDSGFELGLFIGGISALLNSSNFDPLFKLEHILESVRNCSVTLFSESDTTQKKFNVLTHKCSLFFDHVLLYPMYSESDCKQFVQYNNSMWHMKLKPEIEQEIIRLSGGYLWLISQLQRFIRDNPNSKLDDAFNDIALHGKLDVIWGKFSEEEKKLIRKIVQGSEKHIDRSSHEFNHLLKMRIIKIINNKAVLRLPLLAEVVNKEQNMDRLRSEKERIYLEETDITNQFSLSELKFLTVLLVKKQHIVTREEIAKVLWGESWEDRYSDWALDRLAYRLRTKLQNLMFDQKLLKSVKRKGFLFG